MFLLEHVSFSSTVDPCNLFLCWLYLLYALIALVHGVSQPAPHLERSQLAEEEEVFGDQWFSVAVTDTDGAPSHPINLLTACFWTAKGLSLLTGKIHRHTHIHTRQTHAELCASLEPWERGPRV